MPYKGQTHEYGPAYCWSCNKVSTVIEYCIHGESEDSEAAWSHPYVECCHSDDTDVWTDLAEHDSAVEVIEQLAKRLRETHYGLKTMIDKLRVKP